MSRKTRKLIWSAPLVAVLAVAGALAMFVAQMPGTALAHDLPGAVTNLMVDDADFRTIDLSWDAPADGMVDSYRIDRSTDGNVWMTHKTGVIETKYQDTMLTAGTDYYYRVFAVNSAGTGPVSGEVTGATKVSEAPGTVRGLTARATDQNTVVLNWMAPASDGGTKITGYKIAVADDDDGSAVIVATLPEATVVETTAASTEQIILTGDDAVMYTHKMRMAGIRYQYNVYAVNATGTSAEPGDTVAATTHELLKPGAPTGVTAVQTGDPTEREFSLYWFAPTNIGGFITDADAEGEPGHGIIDTTYTVEVAYNGSSTFVDAGAYTADATTSADATHTVPADYDHDGDTTNDNVAITKVRYRVYTVTRPDDPATPLPVNEELKSTSAGMSRTMDIITDAARDKNIPGVPTAVTSERDSFKNVDLEWTAPALDKSTPDTVDDFVESISGFRIDVSDDGVNWKSLVSSTGKADPKYNYVDTEKKTRLYRVFAKHAQFLGPAADPSTSTLTTNVTDPGHVTGLRATAAGPTQIDLSWTAPTDNGNAPIVEYRVQMALKGTDGTFADWPADVTTAGNFKVSKTTSYSHKNEPDTAEADKLKAGQTWRYRVVAVNEDADEAQRPTNATGAGAEVREATTAQAALPEAPEGLTAEAAKDSNLEGVGNRGVLLQWNAPNPPDGATIDGYRVQRKKGDAAWETIADDTNSTDTDYTDTSEPAAGELRAYQVAALNGSKAGAWAMVYYPHALTQPGKPTLTATKDADMPGTKVKLTWTEPAMNADLVTGYIIERRHAGDMMGDIPSDGYNAGVMGRSFAFSNHMEWWETLNCKGMLAAAGSDADPTMDSADKTMYCAHYAMTKPTNMAGTITAGSDVDMKIKEMFMKRYVTDDMGKTMTMFTGMMYPDMGLMENTEYTYRIRAIHGMKAGMWSDKVMVTTGSDNNDPMPNDMVIAPVTVEAGTDAPAMDVSRYFSDDDMDELTYRATSDDDDKATANIPTGSSMLTITGVAEGSATITVYASDGKRGTDAMRTIDVTVTAAVLGPPTNVMAMVDDADPGSPGITVTWMDGANADVHDVGLVDLSDYSVYREERIAGVPSAMTHTFANVVSGRYMAIVVSTSPTDPTDFKYGVKIVSVP